MKKYIIFALLAISILLISPGFAYDKWEDPYLRPDIRNQFSDWTETYVNGTYVMTSNRVYVEAWYVDVTLDNFAEAGNNIDYYDYFAVPNYFAEYSRVNVYDSAVSINTIERIHLEGDGTSEPPQLTAYHEFDENNYMAEKVYLSITIVLDESLNETARNNIRYDLENPEGVSNSIFMTVEVGQWAEDQWYEPGEDFAAYVANLPETEGTLEDRDLYGIGDVISTREGEYTAFITIFYAGMWEIEYNFEDGTDMSLFDEDNEMYYYTDENGKYIVINDGESSMFTTDDWNSQEFISYTVWNLETNELVTFDKFDVFLYLTLGAANHILGFFYVDEFIIDRLISVNSLFQYRWDPANGEPTEWEEYSTILEDTERVEGGVSWQYQLALYSGAASLAALTIPGVGFPLFLIGSTISIYYSIESIQNISEGENIFIGSHDEIEEVNLYELPDVTKDKIDSAYQDVYGRGETMDLSTYNLYRLDYGGFNKVGYEVDVNDDPETINVIQFTYITDGQLYTVDEESIQLDAVVDWSLDPNNDYGGLPIVASNWLQANEWVWYIVAGLGFIVLNRELNPRKKPLIFVILVAIALGILIYFGVIPLP